MIVLWDGRGVASAGQLYENSYVWAMKMHEGKFIDGTTFHDSISSTTCGPESKPASDAEKAALAGAVMGRRCLRPYLER